MLDIQIRFKPEKEEMLNYLASLNSVFSMWFNGKRITKTVRFNMDLDETMEDDVFCFSINNPYPLFQIKYDAGYYNSLQSVADKKAYVKGIIINAIKIIKEIPERFNPKSIDYLNRFIAAVEDNSISNVYELEIAVDKANKLKAQLLFTYFDDFAILSLVMQKGEKIKTVEISKHKPYYQDSDVSPLRLIYNKLYWVDNTLCIEDKTGEIKFEFNFDEVGYKTILTPNTMSIADLERFSNFSDLDIKEYYHFAKNYSYGYKDIAHLFFKW